MRQMISGVVAAVAVVAASTAPAMACGGLFTGVGCSPCWAYSPCAGYAAYERLPAPTQYFYVNQGPTFSGPGNFAPVPTYQEAAVSGWGAYRHHPYYYPYDGGRYAHAMHHYYDGAPVTGPVVYSYRWHHAHRHGLRYGHASHRHGHVQGTPHHRHGHHHPVAHGHH